MPPSAIFQPDHPTPEHAYDAMTEPMWEALAVAAAENMITARPDPAAEAALIDLGLLFPTLRPTAAGYALLLSWHRRHRPPRFPWSLFAPPDNRHVQRMRNLWNC